MSASAITGPSWTPWDSKHAKGAALGEMSLPNPTKSAEEARKTEEASDTDREEHLRLPLAHLPEGNDTEEPLIRIGKPPMIGVRKILRTE